MQMRPLGNTGIEVSRLCLGTMTLPPDSVCGYGLSCR
jgi:aryl-alcohol dehydrogenase-like predicted oxidoreductase